jgi:hypothetical protein
MTPLPNARYFVPAEVRGQRGTACGLPGVFAGSQSPDVSYDVELVVGADALGGVVEPEGRVDAFVEDALRDGGDGAGAGSG